MPDEPATPLERLAVVRAAVDGIGTLARDVTPADLGSVLGALGELNAFACDAAIIPVVLGSERQILGLGREVRLFDLAQT